MISGFKYVGSELEIFSRAVNWKRYFCRQLDPFIRGDVLEVGAGIGGTTRILLNGKQKSWTCLEPDAELANQLAANVKSRPIASDLDPAVIVGTTSDLSETTKFDAILYIDVLEHVEHDAAELQTSAKLLREGGYLIVLSPAHQWLFSPFDHAVGHFRRYNRATLAKVVMPGSRLVRLRYLDSVGLLASLGNRVLLKASMPNPRQIRLWDGLMVPCSRILDPLLRFGVGKTIVAVWQRLPVN